MNFVLELPWFLNEAELVQSNFLISATFFVPLLNTTLKERMSCNQKCPTQERIIVCRPAKILKIGMQIIISLSGQNEFCRHFALAREIIHNHESGNFSKNLTYEDFVSG